MNKKNNPEENELPYLIFQLTTDSLTGFGKSPKPNQEYHGSPSEPPGVSYVLLIKFHIKSRKVGCSREIMLLLIQLRCLIELLEHIVGKWFRDTWMVSFIYKIINLNLVNKKLFWTCESFHFIFFRSNYLVIIYSVALKYFAI